MTLHSGHYIMVNYNIIFRAANVIVTILTHDTAQCHRMAIKKSHEEIENIDDVNGPMSSTTSTVQ